MVHFILEILVEAAVILLLARFMQTIVIRSFGTAVGVALVLGILNATIGWLLRIPLNVVTLFLLTFIVRVLVSAVMIKVVDKLFSGFEVKGFKAALVLALAIALAGLALDATYYN